MLVVILLYNVSHWSSNYTLQINNEKSFLRFGLQMSYNNKQALTLAQPILQENVL